MPSVEIWNSVFFSFLKSYAKNSQDISRVCTKGQLFRIFSMELSFGQHLPL